MVRDETVVYLLGGHDGWFDGQTLLLLACCWIGLYLAGTMGSTRVLRWLGWYQRRAAARPVGHAWRRYRPRAILGRWLPLTIPRIGHDVTAITWRTLLTVTVVGGWLTAIDLLLIWGGPALLAQWIPLDSIWALAVSWLVWVPGRDVPSTVGRAGAGTLVCWLWLHGQPVVALALPLGTLLAVCTGAVAYKAVAAFAQRDELAATL